MLLPAFFVLFLCDTPPLSLGPERAFISKQYRDWSNFFDVWRISYVLILKGLRDDLGRCCQFGSLVVFAFSFDGRFLQTGYFDRDVLDDGFCNALALSVVVVGQAGTKLQLGCAVGFWRKGR